MNNDKKTEIVKCPKYKKKYYMEVVSYVGKIREHSPNTLVETVICPACGLFHTIEIGEDL